MDTWSSWVKQSGHFIEPDNVKFWWIPENQKSTTSSGRNKISLMVTSGTLSIRNLLGRKIYNLYYFKGYLHSYLGESKDFSTFTLVGTKIHEWPVQNAKCRYLWNWDLVLNLYALDTSNSSMNLTETFWKWLVFDYCCAPSQFWPICAFCIGSHSQIT